jgi:hypothetical protein
MVKLPNSQVTSFDAWRIYKTMAIHFKEGSSFDCFKYNFRFKACTPGAYNGSNQKYTFERLARQYPREDELIVYYLSNFLIGRSWINDFSDEPLYPFRSKIDGFTYEFSKEMKSLRDFCDTYPTTTFDSLFMVAEDQQAQPMPFILGKLMYNDLSLNAVTCLDLLLGFSKRLPNKIVQDPLGLNTTALERIKKYRPFLQRLIDVDKMRWIVIESFTRS